MDKYGNIYDHFAIAYQWKAVRGVIIFPSAKRNGWQLRGGTLRTEGLCSAKNRHAILAGDDAWRYRGEDNDMYQTEHDTLFKAVREAARPLTTGAGAAHSTMVAILGRMVAYTGQKITYADALASEGGRRPRILIGNKNCRPRNPRFQG